MVYTFKELKEKGMDAYNINRLVKEKKLYKIEKGLYSDTLHYDQMEYITKKYPKTILTDHSAFYLWNLTDEIPDCFDFACGHNVLKIKDKNIRQTFMSNTFLLVGKTEVKENNAIINVYDKERMLIELIRKKKKYSYSLYKEIINNYRNIADEIDTYKLKEYLKSFKNGDKILNTIMKEVF